MSRLILNEQATPPSAPAAGKAAIYVTSDTPTQLHMLDDNGNNLRALDSLLLTAKGDLLTAAAPNTPATLSVGANGYQLVADNTQAQGLRWAAPTVLANQNIADIVCNAADTYLTGSALAMPPGVLRAGSQLWWRLLLSKTNAGVAAPTWSVRYGTTGSLTDAARLTITGPTQTAAVDAGYLDLMINVRSVGVSGTLQCGFSMTHNLATTGLMTVGNNVQAVLSAPFDTTPANSVIGLSANPAASGVWTFQLVQARAVL